MKSKGIQQRMVWVARDRQGSGANCQIYTETSEPQLLNGLWHSSTGIVMAGDYRRARRLGILKVTLRPGEKRRLPVGEVFGE